MGFREFLVVGIVFMAQTFGICQYPALIQDISLPYSISNLSSYSALINAFKKAHQIENQKLNTSIPDLNFPSEIFWRSLSDDERVLWILNEERKSRKILPYKGIDFRVDSISDYYAHFLVNNNKFEHTADGKTLYQRYTPILGVNGCIEKVSENLGFIGTYSALTDSNFVGAYSVYNLLYDDSSSSWGHRGSLLNTLKKNNPDSTNEGIIGIGLVSAKNFAPNQVPIFYSKILVLHIIDPCSTWDFKPKSTPITALTSYFTAQENIQFYVSNQSVFIESNAFIKSHCVYGLDGKILIESSGSKIDVSDLVRGVYIVSVITDDNVVKRERIYIE